MPRDLDKDSEHDPFFDEIQKDIDHLVLLGLIDPKLNDQGQWVYKPSAKMLSLSEEEIHDLIHPRDDE